MGPITLLSAFLNNTPVVATGIPLIQTLAQKIRIPASKLLIPLSYASILGGTCTLIGTSTNLVAVGLAQAKNPGFSMGLFDIGMVGLPVMVAGLLYMGLSAGWLLPDRQTVTTLLERPREYITVMFVRKTGEAGFNGKSLDGKTVAGAGLRSLNGLYLVRIERETQTVVSAPGPEEILQAGDKLFFAGIVDSVLSLRQIRGLRLADESVGLGFWNEKSNWVLYNKTFSLIKITGGRC